MRMYFLSGRKRDKKFRNYHFSPDHIMSCCNCLFSFKSIVHCTFTLKCFFYHICIWLRNEWWSFKIFVVEHFQSVWWWKARKNRLRIIYFMEEILRTLELQKSTTLSAMAEKEERKGKKSTQKAKEFNKFALFVSDFFSYFNYVFLFVFMRAQNLWASTMNTFSFRSASLFVHFIRTHISLARVFLL